jgi:hypothetical protein
MVALGQLSPIDSVRARLQDQIGSFLSGRAKLSRLMKNPSLVIKGQAQGLYAVQIALENRLQNEITPKLQALSQGVWDASDVLTLGGFISNIMSQINGVSKLERQAGGLTPSIFEDIPTMLGIGGVLLVLGVASGMFFGRRTA